MLLRTSFPSDSYYLREKPFTAAAAQENFSLSLSLSWGSINKLLMSFAYLFVLILFRWCSTT